MVSRWSLAAVLLMSAASTLQLDLVCDSCRCTNKPGTSPIIKSVDCSNQRITAGFPNADSWAYDAREPNDTLMEVNFEHNGMVRVHPLPEVRIVSVSYKYNQLTTVDSDAFIGPSATLEEIDLSSNSLTQDSLRPQAFRGSYDAKSYLPLPKLRVIKLARNALHSLHPDLFENLPALEELYLDFNPMPVLDLLTIQAISSIVNLKVLSLSNMGLTTIPNTMLYTPRNLTVLNIGGNRMTEIPEALAHARNLNKIVLDGNPIRVLHNQSMPLLTEVKSLSLSHMPELVAIEDGALSGLVALEEFHCEQNPQLSDIESYALNAELQGYERKPLRILHLNNNRLSYLHRNMVLRWESLESITLYGNPWSCDCLNQWMITDLVPLLDKIDPSIMTKLICYEPDEMAGKSFRDLSFHSPHLRCLDKYGNHPEEDGAMLIGLVIGLLIAIPIVISLFMMYKKRTYIFSLCQPGGGHASAKYNSRGAGDYSNAFYKRADSVEEI